MFYLYLNLIIISLPLLLSFNKKVAYWRRWPSVFKAILITGTVYIFWDILAVKAGHWSFSERYTEDWRLFGLPVSEFLFFFTVPYACLFTYESIRAYVPERRFRFPLWLCLSLSAVFALIAIFFSAGGYSTLAMAFMALFFAVCAAVSPCRQFLGSRQVWLYLAGCYIPFGIFNGILTALPVVNYGTHAIWGVRIYTIPVEDFFYNFSLLGFNLIIHLLLRRENSG